MTDPHRPIDEDDLHAFVDGRLPPGRHEALQRYLDADADAARRVAAYQAQRAALRAALIVEEAGTLPRRLDFAQILQERRHRRLRDWRIAASIVLALGIGTAGGWFLQKLAAPGRTQLAMQLLDQQALASHLVYAADHRHPIEVSAADEPHLQQWLSNRLGHKLAMPDLSSLGFRMIGGRLLATEHGAPAALLMYDDAAGHRLSLLLRPMAHELWAPWTNINEAGLDSCIWIEKGMGYALVAAMPDTELNRVARQVRSDFGI